MKTSYIAALGAFGAALAFPLAAQAAPLGAAAPAIGQLSAENANLVQVQQRFYRGGRGAYRAGNFRGGSTVNRSALGGRTVGRGFVHRGGYGYWNGHRGYRYARPGYRYYNGWWLPAAALATGAIIGGAIAAQAEPVYVQPAPVYGVGVGLSAQHYSWCEQRYISYRAADNTFQPYNGPRQQCYSPYS
jgi:hypothetical protein